MHELTKKMQQRLSDAGYKSALVSREHLSDLKYDVGHLLEQGALNRDFYDNIVKRYDLDFRFRLPADFQEGQSIIITAAPQPKVIVTFNVSRLDYSVLIPPTYIHDSDSEVRKIVSHYLQPDGYRIQDAILPEKPLAVHSGLAAYGKNNIAYIDGLGSYFRLKVFFSDLPCISDNWQELKMMDYCKNCSACYRGCPANAISEDRFLIDAEKCITYFNEGDDEFPEWIDPSWHNCMIGCMVCQDVCPVNKDHTKWIIVGEEFSEDETEMILDGMQEQDLPQGTIEKLKRMYMWDDYRLLRRNLGVLVKKIQGQKS